MKLSRSMIILSFLLLCCGPWPATAQEDAAQTQYDLGVKFAEQENYAKAIEAYKEAIRLKPYYAEAQYNLGFIYGKLGHYQQAMAAFKEVIRLKPDDAKAHQILGFLYSQQGRNQEAVEAYKEAIRLKPDYIYVTS